MDQAARGKKALDAKMYDEAITEFTAALQSSPTSPAYLIQRSVAYQRAGKYEAALADANEAVINAVKRAKREQIVEGQFRRGVALWSLGRYGDAEFVFSVVKRKDEKHKMLPTWLQKTKTSLDKLDENDEKRQCVVKEMPEAGNTTAKSNGEAASTSASTGANESVSSSQAVSTAPQQTPVDKIRHEWYQNSQNVYFTLLAKGVPKDKAQIDIQERSLTISFPLITGSSYDFTLDPLFGPVDPQKSVKVIHPTKVEVILAKANPGQKWSSLESSASIKADTDSLTNTDDKPTTVEPVDKKAEGPMYPTSSKSGPKNWDKITKDLGKKDGDGKEDSAMGDDDDFEGGDEANAFFKKLFKGSSPEVQRAMMKSYTESNGTALSTNWEEVSKGKVETVPPDGMEAKDW